MAFLARSGTDAKERSGLHGEHGALEVGAVGGPTGVTVTFGYPHARPGDRLEAVVVAAGDPPPSPPLHTAEVLAYEQTTFADDQTVAAIVIDLPSGDYDVYHRCATAAGPATRWTNLPGDRAEDRPAPLTVAVGRAADRPVTDVGGLFGGSGAVIDL